MLRRSGKKCSKYSARLKRERLFFSTVDRGVRAKLMLSARLPARRMKDRPRFGSRAAISCRGLKAGNCAETDVKIHGFSSESLVYGAAVLLQLYCRHVCSFGIQVHIHFSLCSGFFFFDNCTFYFVSLEKAFKNLMLFMLQVIVKEDLNFKHPDLRRQHQR